MNQTAKLDCPMRFIFALISAFIWIGIALTGFSTVSWFMYLPAIGTAVVAITGICMGTLVTKRFCQSNT